MYFIKLIIFCIIFEFLACFGIEPGSSQMSTSEVLSESMKTAVSYTAISGQDVLVYSLME